MLRHFDLKQIANSMQSTAVLLKTHDFDGLGRDATSM